MDNRLVISTLHYPGRTAWQERVRTFERAQRSPSALIRDLVRAATTAKAVVLSGHSTVDMAVAAMIARQRSRPWIVLTECTWALGDTAASRMRQRIVLRSVDGPHVRYCVGSTAERERFPRTWNVDPERVVYVPWFHYLSDEELRLDDRDGDGIFAGGDSYRDYGTLIESARSLPVQVTIAAHHRSAPLWSALPDNVTAASVPHERFVALMRASAIVVTPLVARDDRSAGQATYLNAMAMGKLTIVSETLGVRDYIEHGRTGLVLPPGDVGAMRDAVAWALDTASSNEVATIRARGREVARAQFGPERYLAKLNAVVDHLPDRAG
jgi:glycosyltransferase involved in cell wall biosynthesis